MLRLRSETGWWLISHPDHARLAGAFAAGWGNELFAKPEPRARVLFGIGSHDDGWALRDVLPRVTREGKPSAFSTELVGKYSAFEEIELKDYLAVRERAVRIIADQDAYAGMLIALHTYNLLSAHADRSTIRTEDLPLLDDFLAEQRVYQEKLLEAILKDPELTREQKAADNIDQNFRLLQACDNLSLLSCVDYQGAASLLHPLLLNDGGHAEIQVISKGVRSFRLEPWPFGEAEIRLRVPARHVEGFEFDTSEDLQAAYQAAAVAFLSVTLHRQN